MLLGGIHRFGVLEKGLMGEEEEYFFDNDYKGNFLRLYAELGPQWMKFYSMVLLSQFS